DHAARLAALRAELAARDLAGFVVPHSDEFQNEYLPPHAERLAWLTGFDGSAGTSVVLAGRAALFVDGRYTLQVREQADPACWEFRHLIDEPVAGWLGSALQAGDRLGYDAWLHTPRQVEGLRAACTRAGAELVAVGDNPLDAVWTDQPPPPTAPIVPHPDRFAGRASADKRAEIAGALNDAADCVVLTAPDSIAWLLNVRGGDVAHTPLPLSLAILHRDATVDWCVDPAKLTDGLAAHLGNAVRLQPMDAFGDLLDALGRDGKSVQVAADSAPAWVFDRLAAAGAELSRAADPVTLPKACKNDVEIEGCRHAHARDAVAIARFLAWIDTETPRRPVGEIEAADRLAAFRAEGEHFRDLSFDTISGSGSHGAIVHYRVTAQTDRSLQAGELYLVDSGAQYLDGTTDITRTVAIGTPTAEMRERFTRVLKGHIAIATARFPAGTTGAQLDTLARFHLWQAGLDFDHGTGHGVGSYLGVHEGPQRISKAGTGAALEPGMVVSNEPGYYKTGEYGIRIENLVIVRPAAAPDGAEKPLLEFETVTLAPIDRRLVDTGLLTGDEIAWLDAYHARVRETVGPMLDADTRAWLDAATAAL
ncbi:unnamed protein product, partial [Discosporangium mesarthrocarpum]